MVEGADKGPLPQLPQPSAKIAHIRVCSASPHVTAGALREDGVETTPQIENWMACKKLEMKPKHDEGIVQK